MFTTRPPTNVQSGLDYSIQEDTASHLHDIAVRNAVSRLGREFSGDHLVEIRGHTSEGYRLNPGQVPFHLPDKVLLPSQSAGTWWKSHSIEDFWQSNKVLVVRSGAEKRQVHDYVFQNLKPARPQKTAVAVFGGSFNPIHLGHLRIAQELVDQYRFDKVVFVPNGDGYRKKGLIGEKHRAAMVRLAIQSEPRFEICEFELDRTESVRTVDTLNYLREKTQDCETQLFNIRGSDTINRMLKWHSLPEILSVAQIIPIRPGFDSWDAFGAEALFRLHSRSFFLMPRNYADGLSSSTVRNTVKSTGSAAFLVPESVNSYIRENQLYGAST